MADEMTVIDASGLASIDYSQYLYDYFAAAGTTAGTGSYYDGVYTNRYGYYSGDQWGVRYGSGNDKQVLVDGANMQYDGINGVNHGAFSGDINSITFGRYDDNTTWDEVTNTSRGPMTGVLADLVISNLNLVTPFGTSSTSEDNLLYSTQTLLTKAPVLTDDVAVNVQGLYALFASKAQHFIGSDGNDNYAGTEFGDLINGGLGADTMAGGLGDDVYIVDNAGDVVVELENGGTDTVESSLNDYTLADNVENLTLTGAALIGSGNELDNVIIGNELGNTLYGFAGNDTLDGGLGADTMVGGDGDDTYYVDNRSDVITELADGGIDTMYTTITHQLMKDNVENLVQNSTVDQMNYGNALDNTMWANSANSSLMGQAGNDTLYGGIGNNTLDGGDGVDTMIGGAGDDVYGVDNIGDVVTELADEGVDEVMTSLNNYVLGAFLENLTLLSSSDDEVPDADLNGSGNELANIIVGNDGNNSLYGFAGNDTLYGGDGNDVLDGGKGADTMSGGAGNDTYIVDNKNDKVVEVAGEGTDTVSASIAYTLGDTVENLTLTGTGNIKGNGNAFNNVLTGNSGNNTLLGYAGNDTINGGAGNDVVDGGDGKDTLTGGAGNDVLKGGAGNDVLSGNAGNDSLYGGLGKDVLTGGAGADTFFFATGDTAAGKNGADSITDFRGKQGDLINLVGMDANEFKKGNQGLDFIGKDAFSGEIGELRFEKGKSDTYIYGDTDGDGKADFTIHLQGSFNLNSDFFVL